jgi:hypothetical protein
MFNVITASKAIVNLIIKNIEAEENIFRDIIKYLLSIRKFISSHYLYRMKIFFHDDYNIIFLV